MVIESLINPLKANRRPVEMFFIGAFYSSFAILLSLLIFREDSSLVMIFLTVLACAQFMYGAIKIEEVKEMNIVDRKFLFKEHGRTLLFFMYIFLGFVFSYLLWFSFLPDGTVQDLFRTQIRDINYVQELKYDISGNVINYDQALSDIFLNNLLVLFFCLVFSFFYGVGSIFVLTWNASVIGAAIGIFIRTNLTASHLSNISIGIIGMSKYLLHGIPEIFAYFAGGLAGGIISIAIIRHDYGSPNFKKVIKDSFDLIILSIFILFIAALIEVFITPVLF